MIDQKGKPMRMNELEGKTIKSVCCGYNPALPAVPQILKLRLEGMDADIVFRAELGSTAIGRPIAVLKVEHARPRPKPEYKIEDWGGWANLYLLENGAQKFLAQFRTNEDAELFVEAKLATEGPLVITEPVV